MFALASTTAKQAALQVMPDDYSELVPPLPIPNRTVKRLCADDSAATSVKVGHRQASYKRKTPAHPSGGFLFCASDFAAFSAGQNFLSALGRLKRIR